MKKSFIIQHLDSNLNIVQKSFVNSVKRNAEKSLGNFDLFEHNVRVYADKVGYCVSTFVGETQLRVAESLKRDDFLVITLL